MVLYHVAKLSDLVIVGPTPFNADGFSDGNLHMINTAIVPLRINHSIGKTQGEQILYGFFTQIMIDTIDITLGKVLTHGIVYRSRTF